MPVPGPVQQLQIVADVAAVGAPLLQAGNLLYAGAFRLPTSSAPVGPTFSYGGRAMGIKSGLFLLGHDTSEPTYLAELTLPAPVAVPVSTPRGSPLIGSLPRATFVQPFADPLDGHLSDIGAGSKKIGGVLPWGSSLLVTAYLFYDAMGVQTKTHFVSGQTLATVGDVQGPFVVPAFGPSFINGYMTPIPPEWQAALGGPALTGQCCLSVLGRTSFGPSCSVFDPANLPAGATMVLGYTQAHPTLGTDVTPGPLFNAAVAMGGCVFPKGSRSVLFFGRLGHGSSSSPANCYGDGVSGTPGVGQCLDPSETAKGYHAYPYESFVWAYDVLDLIAVKQGTKQPWSVLPYATWPITLPFAFPSKILTSVAYDAMTSRIYLAQQYGDGDTPLIHVLTVH